ncbi:MAG: outer membrane beta-barrel protein [Kiritimatiellae bacterium]|nr:outer membrane beta-barrel protein [Kiritimatiellia bacterium]
MRRCLHFFAALAGFYFSLLLRFTVAGPGDGIVVGSWVLSPYVELNTTYDSNVYKDYQDEIADWFFEPELGLRFSSAAETNRISIRGNVYYSDRQYQQEKNRAFNTYGDHITLRHGNGQRALIELIQSFRHLDDNDRHAADIEGSMLSAEMVEDSNTLDLERDVHQLGAEVSRRMSDKLNLALAYRYAGVQYENETHDRLDPKQLGVPQGLNLDGHILELNGALGLTDKTDAFVTLRYGQQYQEDTPGAAKLSTIRVGLNSHGTDKLMYTAAIGIERYQRPIESEADADIYFSFNASADWFSTEKLTFRCGGFNGTQFSSFYLGNGMEYISGWAGMGYRWKPSITFSVRGVYRRDDYLDPVTHLGETKDRMDDRVEGHARVDYVAPGGFLRLYLEGTYDEVDSNFDFVDYVDQRIMLGAIIRY